MNLATLQLVSQSAATAALSALWQDAVLLTGIWLCLRLAPRTTAALRFKIWAAAFLIMIAVMVALPFQQLLPHAQSAVATTAAAPSTKPLLELDPRWSLAILALWLAASLYRAADLAVHGYRLRSLWKTATPVESTPINTPRNAQLCLSEAVQRPSVIGFLSPRILIPNWLFDKLTPAELQQIVLHESQHLRRNDDWTNLLQKLALILFPINPALLWVERKLCSEREMACDEGVIQVTHAPRAYATCLTRLAERNLQHRTEALSLGTLSLGTWQRRSDLVPRVHSILTRKHALNATAARALLVALVAAMTVGSIELSHTPQLVSFTAPPTPTLNALTYANEVLPTHPTPTTSRTPTPTHPRVSAHRKSQNQPTVQAITEPTNPQEQAELQNTVTMLPVEDAAREQSWLVLTTWQQTYPTQPGDPDVTNQPTRPAAQKLILRHLPQGSFITPTFAAVPTRNGWLVIQL